MLCLQDNSALYSNQQTRLQLLAVVLSSTINKITVSSPLYMSAGLLSPLTSNHPPIPSSHGTLSRGFNRCNLWQEHARQVSTGQACSCKRGPFESEQPTTFGPYNHHEVRL